MENKELRETIVDLLVNKATVKQDIADYAESVMEQFRQEMVAELDALSQRIDDRRIRLKFEDKGNFEFMVYIGSDVLVFQLHRNVFRLPDEHGLWQTDYLKENEANGYFGVINIYNFLAESYEQNRLNDVGYLIGRVFMNREKHCMVEGKGPLEQFKDLLSLELSTEIIHGIIQCAIVFAIDFDLVTPPYEMIQQATVMQIREISSELQMATGKRLGFKFSSEDKTFF